MLANGIKVIDDAAAPASDAAMYAALGWLSSLTALREGNEDQGEMKLRAMASVLQDYPGGVSIPTIREWPSTKDGKWWPTAHEMIEQCEARMDFRRALQTRFESAMNAPPAIEFKTVGRMRRPWSGEQEGYFTHARVKIGLRDYDRFTEATEFSEGGVHTTPEFYQRLTKPPFVSLLTTYGVELFNDFGNLEKRQ